MSILLKSEIEKEITAGNINIDPLHLNNINPNSIDLTLADTIYRYEENNLYGYMNNVLDSRRENPIRKLDKIDDGYILEPGIGYLARTNEKTWTDKYVMIVEGRSSYGRLFLQVHATAGFGDIGFNGFWTLELSVTQPLIVYPNSRICQVFFNTIKGSVDYLYDGKYQNNIGLQASKAYEDN